MDEKDKLIVLALAENNMQVKTAARQLHMHYNSVYYRVDRIYDNTGLDPRNFYDLHKLVAQAKMDLPQISQGAAEALQEIGQQAHQEAP